MRRHIVCVISIFVLLPCSTSLHLHAELPVVDFLVFKQAYDAFIEGDRIFDKMRFQLKLLKLLKGRTDVFTRSVLHALRKLSWEEIEQTMAFDTYIYLEPAYFLIDKYQKETWYKVFKRLASLTDIYVLDEPVINQENPIYQKNRKVRRFIDQSLKFQERDLQDLLNLTALCADHRSIQCVRAESIKSWNVASKLFSSPQEEFDIKAFHNSTVPTTTASHHKMIYLITRLELENLKQKLERNMIQRSNLEKRLKRRVREDVILKTFQKLQNEEIGQ